jgi:hypothetical protein
MTKKQYASVPYNKLKHGNNYNIKECIKRTPIKKKKKIKKTKNK